MSIHGDLLHVTILIYSNLHVRFGFHFLSYFIIFYSALLQQFSEFHDTINTTNRALRNKTHATLTRRPPLRKYSPNSSDPRRDALVLHMSLLLTSRATSCGADRVSEEKKKQKSVFAFSRSLHTVFFQFNNCRSGAKVMQHEQKPEDDRAASKRLAARLRLMLYKRLIY